MPTKPTAPADAAVLLITGTLGAGKSVIADEIHEQLCVADIPNAMIDLDHLGSAWPRKVDVFLRNLSAVSANYRADGIDRLVLASMPSAGPVQPGSQRSGAIAAFVLFRPHRDAGTGQSSERSHQGNHDAGHRAGINR